MRKKCSFAKIIDILFVTSYVLLESLLTRTSQTHSSAKVRSSRSGRRLLGTACNCRSAWGRRDR